eukprot:jgi/Ulvmu1/2627/UM014_0079.1
MGKGKGKGGCGLLEGIGDCIQCIAGTICCLCVSGPILIIVGIVFIVSAFDDTRGERIDEFNVAVDAWNGGAVDNFNAASANDWTYSLADTCGNASLNEAQLPQSEAAEDLLFEEDERGEFGSYPRVSYYEDAPDPVTPESGCTFNFQFAYQGTSIGNVSVPAVTSVTQGFSEICTQSSTSSSNTNQAARRRQEDVQRCANTCRAQGGVPDGTSIQGFRCQKTNVPAEVCVRVTLRNDQWVIAQGALPDRSGATGSGCFLNNPPSSSWDDARLESVASLSGLRIPVRVRHEKDPYLYFLDISRGTGDFGLKTSEKLIIGFTCLAIGILITLLVCGCCCVIFKFARSFAKGKQEKPSNPVGAALYDVSAKYGNYIPGGTAIGQPVGGTATGVPAANVQKPPAGYNDDSSYQYGSGTPYEQGQSNAPYGAAPYGDSSQPPYGNSAPYGGGGPAQPPYGNTPYGGNNAGAPPPGYPAAV